MPGVKSTLWSGPALLRWSFPLSDDASGGKPTACNCCGLGLTPKLVGWKATLAVAAGMICEPRRRLYI